MEIEIQWQSLTVSVEEKGKAKTCRIQICDQESEKGGKARQENWVHGPISLAASLSCPSCAFHRELVCWQEKREEGAGCPFLERPVGDLSLEHLQPEKGMTEDLEAVKSADKLKTPTPICGKELSV